MQQKLQQFVFLSERILSEAGELRVRKTWNELCSVSTQLSPYMVQLAQNFDPKYALLFLLSCGNDGTQKNGCLSMLFRKILSNIPNKDLFSVLSSVNRVELNSYLLPFLYEKGDIGSVAAYVAAKLDLKVNIDSFEFFLTSREWSQEDLVNLSFLVLSDDRDSLIMNLDSLYNTNRKEVFAQFLNVLNAPNVTEPVIPDIHPPESVNQPPVVNQKPTFVQQKKDNLPSNADYKYRLTTGNRTPSSSSNTFINPPQPQKPVQFAGNPPNNPVVYNPVVNNQNPVPVANPSNSNNTNANTTNNIAADANPNLVVVKEQTNPQEASNTSNNSDLKSNLLGGAKNLIEKVKTSVNESSISFSNGSSGNGFINSLNEKLSALGINTSSSDNPLKQPVVLIAAGIVAIILIILLVWLFSGGSNKKEVVVAPPKVGKIPEYWIDAVTNRKITPQYIEADVDYRMGELYLSRNLYDEAIKFFSSALKTEPNHIIAKLRWGYAELIQGNYFVAKKLLKEVLASEPKLKNVNLYLARTSMGEKDYNNATKYYKDEYRNHGVLEVGLEYANFLQSIGKQDDAMDFLAVLQEKYPDKMLILNASSNNKKSNKNQKTKG